MFWYHIWYIKLTIILRLHRCIVTLIWRKNICIQVLWFVENIYIVQHEKSVISAEILRISSLVASGPSSVGFVWRTWTRSRLTTRWVPRVRSAFSVESSKERRVITISSNDFAGRLATGYHNGHRHYHYITETCQQYLSKSELQIWLHFWNHHHFLGFENPLVKQLERSKK